MEGDIVSSLVQFFEPAGLSLPPAAISGIPAKLLRAAAGLDGKWTELGPALLTLRQAAGLGWPDPRGDIQDIPPTEANMFGDEVPFGQVRYTKGSRADGVAWCLVKYRPGVVVASVGEASMGETVKGGEAFRLQREVKRQASFRFQ
jgi:hypothetical protein